MRDDAQLAQVCQTLCSLVRLPGMWRDGEVTEKAVALLKKNPMSHGERLMFETAWALWNGGAKPDLGELVNTLDGKNLHAIGTLLIALADGSSEAIDWWLAGKVSAQLRRSSGR